MTSDFHKKKVVIIQRYIPKYRKDFFNYLRERLQKVDIDLILTYGKPSYFDSKKNDSVEIDWGVKIRNRIIRVGNKEFYWQPIMKFIKDADLVIVEQANKLLVNHYLLFLNSLKKKRVAYWGHGKNFQVSSANPISEWIKKQLSSKVHWWFAYTQKCADIVHQAGFPYDRITVVQNSINTRELLESLNNITSDELSQLKKNLSINGSHVGLYVGGMYKEKKIEYLIEVCKVIKSIVSDFEMIFIGSGRDAYLVIQMAESFPWVHYVGPKFGKEKLPYFALANVFLMPGAVGLTIVDCFALGLPIVTKDDPDHGPEIDYLQNGINGIMVKDADRPEKYATVVSDLLLDDEKQKRLREGCKSSAEKYTIEQMVDNFAEGILRALQ